MKKWDFPYVEFFWGPKKDRVVEGVLMGGGRPYEIQKCENMRFPVCMIFEEQKIPRVVNMVF